MEIRINTNDLDISALVISHLRDQGFPIPDGATVEVLEDEAVVTFDAVQQGTASTTAAAPKKAPQKKAPQKKKETPPAPEVITTHPNAFVQGDAVAEPTVVDEPVVEDVFPSASDPEVAPSVFSTPIPVSPQATQDVVDSVFG